MTKLVTLTIVVGLGTAALAGDGLASSPARPARPVSVLLRPRVTDPYHSASIAVGGIVADRLEVRLSGAIDRAGLAYEWTPYRWRPLRLLRGRWRGLLPPPALPGIYQLQLRLDRGRGLRTSPRLLLRIFPRGTMSRPSFRTAVAVVRDYVAHLAGDEVLVALKRYPLAAFDHRDTRLHRLFVVAYAPRSDNQPNARLGLFITTVRDGYHGRWRLLRAGTGPYG